MAQAKNPSAPWCTSAATARRRRTEPMDFDNEYSFATDDEDYPDPNSRFLEIDDDEDLEYLEEDTEIDDEDEL
jgi:hypothetical protein